MSRSTVAPTLMRITAGAALALLVASCDDGKRGPTGPVAVSARGSVEEAEAQLHPYAQSDAIRQTGERTNVTASGIQEVTGAMANSLDPQDLSNFDVVVHLNGTTYGIPLSTTAQMALESWVNAGHGWVGSQWDGFERRIGQQTSMNNLVMMLHGSGGSSNCGGCTINYSTTPAGVGHPVMAGLPASFNFFADGHDAGDPILYGINPSIALALANGLNPGVLVRDYGAGRVVNFSVAANYFNAQTSLQGVNINKLYVNAAKWASGVGSPRVLLLVDQSGPGTTALINGLSAAGYTVTTFEPEYRWEPHVVTDATPPEISPTVSGTLGTGGWYTSAVTVHWTVTDAESDITSQTGCEDLTLSANQDETTYTCSATSAGGTASESVSIKIDQTVPTVSGAVVLGTLGNNGWYTDDVTIGWTASAAGPSGQSMSADCSDVTLVADSPGTTFTCTVTTGAGISSAEGSLTVKRDATNPSIGYSGNTGAYTVDQTVAITCSASDALSGLASSTCANISGPAYTFALGANAFSASATDNAGNSASAATSFTVSVTSESLCALVQVWVNKPGVANSLCVKLQNAEAADARDDSGAADNMRRAFVNEVKAQTDKSVSSANAAILSLLAMAL